ncbi:MAG: cobalt-precorrin-6A reductase [Sneathiella sp.]|nr:cobalt-precorrin-6A reductase [Sneathiella sp.]
MTDRKKILLVGGTQEGVKLNQLLSARPDIDLVTSLAGRTQNPVPLIGEKMVGGFGGVVGLKKFIRDRHIELVIDASHPFAGRMTQNAFTACKDTGIRYLRYQRPAWKEEARDRWVSAPSIEAAAGQLAGFNRIFLTIGRQELAPFERCSDKFFLIRSIENVDFAPSQSEVEFLRARGPFSMEEDFRLLTEYRIELLISKNSGGAATYAKIAAAREFGIPVLMIERPALPDCSVFSDMEELLRATRL